MGLAFQQAKLHLKPAVCLLPAHEALLPELVQGDMSLPPLFPQMLVCQRSHGQATFPVGRHIGVTERITGADVDLLTGLCVPVDGGRGPEDRRSAAVGAFDVDSFHGFTFFLIFLWGESRRAWHTFPEAAGSAAACSEGILLNCLIRSFCPVFNSHFNTPFQIQKSARKFVNFL